MQKKNKKGKIEKIQRITQQGDQNQNNLPVFSFNHVPNTSNYNPINGYARQAQQNTNGSTTMDINAFKSLFRKKPDAHHQFTHIMHKLMCDIKQYNMYH